MIILDRDILQAASKEGFIYSYDNIDKEYYHIEKQALKNYKFFYNYYPVYSENLEVYLFYELLGNRIINEYIGHGLSKVKIYNRYYIRIQGMPNRNYESELNDVVYIEIYDNLYREFLFCYINLKIVEVKILKVNCIYVEDKETFGLNRAVRNAMYKLGYDYHCIFGYKKKIMYEGVY